MGMVSIITPLFNRAHLLNDTWESVKNQTYEDWEWIVVDDGSTDNSVEVMQRIVHSDNRVKLARRPTTLIKGPSSCRNHGASLANGRYLIFLDSDDLLASDCLQHRVLVMNTNGELDFAVFNMLSFRQLPGDSNKVFNHFLETREDYLRYFLTDNPPWQTMCPIWKSSSFRLLGGFKENYTCMEDPDLHVRALLSNYSFEVLNTSPDCFYRDSFIENQTQHSFWQKSILGRIDFLKDMHNYVKAHVNDEWRKKQYIIYLSEFYVSLIKGFILARLPIYEKEFIDINTWAKEKQIITIRQQIIMRLAHYIFSSKSKLITLLHLRGVIYHLI